MGSAFAGAVPHLRDPAQAGRHRHQGDWLMTPEQKKNNRRMGLVLASIAVVFFIGFIARMLLLRG
jgi:hypothetical protein